MGEHGGAVMIAAGLHRDRPHGYARGGFEEGTQRWKS